MAIHRVPRLLVLVSMVLATTIVCASEIAGQRKKRKARTGKTTKEVTKPDPRKDKKRYVGRFFDVSLDHENKAYAKRVAMFADRAWVAAVEILGAKHVVLEQPYPLKLFLDRQKFDAVVTVVASVDRSQLGRRYVDGGMNGRGGCGYVEIYPKLRPRELHRVGLVGETVDLVMMSVVNLVRFRLIEADMYVPFWISEGLNYWLKSAMLLEKNDWPSRAADPFLCASMAKTVSAWQAKQIASVEKLMGKKQFGRHGGTDIATAHMLFCYLVEKHPTTFIPFLQSMRTVGAGGFRNRKQMNCGNIRKLLLKHIGHGSDLDEGLGTYISQLVPKWKGSSRFADSVAGQIFLNGSDEFPRPLWQYKPVGTTAYEICGRVQILNNGKRGAGIVFGEPWRRATRLKAGVVFYANGKVELRGTHMDEILAKARMHKLQYTKDYPFRIVVKGKTLEVFVSGKKVLTHAHDMNLGGIWGLHVLRQGAAVFRGVEGVEKKEGE